MSDFLSNLNDLPIWKLGFLIADIIIIISLILSDKKGMSILFFLIGFILLYLILKDIGWIKKDITTILREQFP
jgi:hypothetical protein